MKPREIEKLLHQAGWIVMKDRGKGSHRVYRHPDKSGILVLP
ncbi:MAG: type II toxin-antitoxin system HicA family toxin [SAR324 cluster bacterium]|nr:type II toxin-antitoxin system HicA family toxin [SAR324 cluster bacterium]